MENREYQTETARLSTRPGEGKERRERGREGLKTEGEEEGAREGRRLTRTRRADIPREKENKDGVREKLEKMRRSGHKTQDNFKHACATQLKKLTFVSLAHGRFGHRGKCADSRPRPSEDRNRSISMGGVLPPLISGWLSGARPRTLT